MFDAERFSDLIQRIRAGDQDAATELVRDYEGLIRREVRMRLEDSRLRRVLDSVDICQSVLVSFFVRTALGEYDLADPKQLVKLLMMMTRNKVASLARREHSQKRDQRRNSGDGEMGNFAMAEQSTPSQIVANEELLAQVRSLMPAAELQIAELRSQGLDWATIAAQVGGTAQARRVQYSRSLKRIRKQLGIDVEDDE